ncbi:MAG: hypothetical protein JXR52_08670 [Bacteroidales bacterium]|nr:hypothetical protein [Bacteroidales bacterium]MBN2698885.1 hypothetical protein [Bacteroidales bacterium]
MTETFRFNTASFVIALTLMVIAFIVFSFRDALIILFVLNTIICVTSMISGLFPLLGQVGYIWFVLKVLIPVFFGKWFSEIPHNWYADMLVIMGFINSINASVQWVRIRRRVREYSNRMDDYNPAIRFRNPYSDYNYHELFRN